MSLDICMKTHFPLKLTCVHSPKVEEILKCHISFKNEKILTKMASCGGVAHIQHWYIEHSLSRQVMWGGYFKILIIIKVLRKWLTLHWICVKNLHSILLESCLRHAIINDSCSLFNVLVLFNLFVILLTRQYN